MRSIPGGAQVSSARACYAYVEGGAAKAWHAPRDARICGLSSRGSASGLCAVESTQLKLSLADFAGRLYRRKLMDEVSIHPAVNSPYARRWSSCVEVGIGHSVAESTVVSG